VRRPRALPGALLVPPLLFAARSSVPSLLRFSCLLVSPCCSGLSPLAHHASPTSVAHRRPVDAPSPSVCSRPPPLGSLWHAMSSVKRGRTGPPRSPSTPARPAKSSRLATAGATPSPSTPGGGAGGGASSIGAGAETPPSIPSPLPLGEATGAMEVDASAARGDGDVPAVDPAAASPVIAAAMEGLGGGGLGAGGEAEMYVSLWVSVSAWGSRTVGRRLAVRCGRHVGCILRDEASTPHLSAFCYARCSCCLNAIADASVAIFRLRGPHTLSFCVYCSLDVPSGPLLVVPLFAEKRC